MDLYIKQEEVLDVLTRKISSLRERYAIAEQRHNHVEAFRLQEQCFMVEVIFGDLTGLQTYEPKEG